MARFRGAFQEVQLGGLAARAGSLGGAAEKLLEGGSDGEVAVDGRCAEWSGEAAGNELPLDGEVSVAGPAAAAPPSVVAGGSLQGGHLSTAQPPPRGPASDT